MRIFNFKKIALSFLFFALAICSILGASVGTSPIKAAEVIPSYFTVRQYTKYDKDKPEDNIFINIGNNEVAYVASSNVVEAQLYYETAGVNPIKAITPFVKYNGQTINTDVLDRYSIVLDYNTTTFRLTSKFNEAGKTAPYGKYEITLDYIFEDEEGIQTNKSITYSYYVVRDGDYYNGKNVNAQIENATVVEKENVSQLYDRIFQYNYNRTTENDSNKLPTLAFNKHNINIKITKTFQKTTTTQRIWFDGVNLLTDNNLVYITENPDNNFVVLTFNDLGTYVIDYSFTYYNNKTVENIQPAVSLFTNIKRTDLIEVFGYQLYYSDSQTAELKEFKSIDQNGNIGQEITDISYIYNTFNTAIDNVGEGKKFSQTNVIKGKSTDANGYSGILEKLNNDEIKIQQTNQAPVQFKYNVEIFSESNIYETQSKYWKIKVNSDSEYELESDEGFAYDNRPLSESGIYLVNLIYKFYPTIIGSDELCGASRTTSDSPTEKLRSQWFIFKITKETARMTVSTSSGILSDESFTNQTVTISKIEDNTSIFNAATQLDVYFQPNYTGAYQKIATLDNNTQFQVSESGNYEVKMLFGKNLTRSYSSTFTIDKDPIENIQIFAVNHYENSNLYYRNTEIDFMTNQPVIVSWNNKVSGGIITAKYKFIPLVYANQAFDSSLLKQYYDGEYNKDIPSEYYFDYNKNVTLTEIDYRNTQNLTNIPSGNVLTQSGMYIFKVCDSAGNEKFFSFIIDSSPARILQQVDGEFVEPSSLNILSSDVTVVWGEYKVTHFKNLTYSAGEFIFTDTWLDKVFNNEENNIYSKYFKMLTISTINQFYVKSKIDKDVLISTDGVYSWGSGDSCLLSFLNEDKTKVFEHDYTFYIRDEFNTKIVAGEREVSVLNYEENYSATHRVKISSDASLSELVYTKNTNLISLYQDSYSPTPSTEEVNGFNYSKKEKYYIPTTVNTLKESGEILKFMFNPSPEAGVVEVDKIEYAYSDFIESTKTDGSGYTAYTYRFNDLKNISPTSYTTIYDRTNPSVNNTISADGYLYWEINPEYNNITSSYQTKAGRYVIKRTYANLNNTLNAVNDS